MNAGEIDAQDVILASSIQSVSAISHRMARMTDVRKLGS